MSEEKKEKKTARKKKENLLREVVRPFRINGKDYRVGDTFEAESAGQLRVLIETYKYLKP